eukprot:UN18525
MRSQFFNAVCKIHKSNKSFLLVEILFDPSGLGPCRGFLFDP